MELDKWTVKAREALEQARKLCVDKDQQQLTGHHLLYALVEQDSSTVPRL